MYAFCCGRIRVVESICSITAGPTILAPEDKLSLNKISVFNYFTTLILLTRIVGTVIIC